MTGTQLTGHRGEATSLFVLFGKADTDNIAPVIWSHARDNTPVCVLTATSDAYEAVRHAWWSSECPRLEVLAWPISDRFGKLGSRLSRLRWNRWRLSRLIRRKGIGLIAMEWGEGLGSDRGSWWKHVYWWGFADPRRQLLRSARDAQLPTVALPHGHSTKTSLIHSAHVRSVMETHGGVLPFKDRDSFTKYVFASEYHRDVILGHSNMSGQHVEVWGSARFNDEWVRRLYEAVPSADLPDLTGQQVRRVLFFVPKWNNLVDKNLTFALLSQLGNAPSLQVVVRGHLRSGDATIDTEQREVLTRLPNLLLVEDEIPSASLIRGCDVLIDVDSSIAFDAVLLGKPYVRPSYLQAESVQTIWDRLGGAHITRSHSETLSLVTQANLEPAERQQHFDEVVFGGTGASVLERYRTSLRQLLSQRGLNDPTTN